MVNETRICDYCNGLPELFKNDSECMRCCLEYVIAFRSDPNSDKIYDSRLDNIQHAVYNRLRFEYIKDDITKILERLYKANIPFCERDTHCLNEFKYIFKIVDRTQ
jgi:hypothetical protein